MSRGAGQRGLAHDGRYDDGTLSNAALAQRVDLAEQLMTAIYTPLVLTALHQGIADQTLGMPQVGVEAYGIPSVTERPTRTLKELRENALAVARKATAAGSPYVGFRVTPWGGEIVVFGRPEGMTRWALEQAHDVGVWYAATFDLTLVDPTPRSEVHR